MLHLLSLVLALAGSAHALNSFVGCNSVQGNYIAGSPTNAGSYAACTTYCANNYAQPFTSTTPTYSVYGPSVGVTPSFDCACATGHAAYTTTTSSAGTAGQQTTCANAADYAFARINTAYFNNGCYVSGGVNANGNTGGNTITSDGSTDCFTLCGTSPSDGRSLAALPTANGVTCYCDTAFGTGNPITCAPGRVIVFSRTAAATASGLARRRERAAKREAQLALASKLCPKGQQACKVLEGRDYECVDTTNELVSCGGCIQGVFGGKTRSEASGVDCSALPGARLGSYSCVAGQCKASACEMGYELSAEGMCV